MKTLALVDCDAFFCSCERVFRPELKETPIIVLSNNDGCAVSRTKRAKELGIGMGDPYFKVRELCEKNGVAVFSSNFSLYTDMSRRVMNLLKGFSPLVEVYSVDEGFLDLSGIEDPLGYCREIKRIVELYTKIPVSIGLAPTKGLCKAACFLAKREKSYGGVVSLLEKGMQDEVLFKMPMGKIWGIGKGRELQLRILGLKNAGEFRDYGNIKKIQKVLTKAGRQIQDELRGIICFPLSETSPKKKEVMSSRTFGASVFDKRGLAEAVASHASEVAEELRSQGSVCREVLVFIRSNPHKEGSEQYGASTVQRFLTPTANTFKIIEKALEGLDEIFHGGIEYKKAGVRVMGLQDADEHLLSLFEEPETQRQIDLMHSMDQINGREGPRTITSLACGTNDFAWYMNRNFKSPRYTTSWNELPIIR